MKSKILFTLFTLISLKVNAATGTGEVQTVLANPLTVTNTQDINFGTIAIDPAAGTQVVSINPSSEAITCPPTYVCSESGARGRIRIDGAPSTIVNFSIEGELAILSDGLGNTLIFDPVLQTGTDTWLNTISLTQTGVINTSIGGSITFTGNETAGTYSSRNAGGSGYTFTVNY